MNSQLLIDEQLEFIYLVESLDFNKVKSNIDKIKDAFQSKNILKVQKAFTFLPDITASQLAAVAKKKFPGEYAKSEKHIKLILKKGPDVLVQLMIILYASITKVKENVKDESLKEKINMFLDELDKILGSIAIKGAASGLTLVLLAILIGGLLQGSTVIIGLLILAGKILIAVSFILFVIAILVRLFIKAKQTRQKVIK